MSHPIGYAELHCISNFTFLRGASSARELVERAKAQGYAALAITDECSLAGIVRAQEAAQQAGLKLIIGAAFHIDELELVLLAPDQVAYTQLCQVITMARRNAEKGQYRISREDLAQHTDRCLALWIADHEARIDTAAWVRDAFAERAWIAVSLLRRGFDAQCVARALELSARTALPIVAVGGVWYHDASRRPLQDVLTCTRLGCTVETAGLRLEANAERHLRSLDDLQSLYPQDWLDETLRIADRCTFSLEQLRYEYPHEVVPPGRTPSSWLRELTEAGIRRRWPDGASSKVLAQIERELQLIAEMRYESYFLTVADIVTFARSKGILCQGRGSAANSAVCYALGVTEVDPMRMEMLFERFISKERAEPPDIDIDFEHQRREEVIQYLYNRYGRDRAALAATVISYRPKSAIRDVAKALGFAPEVVDRLAKSVYWFDGIDTLETRLAECGLDPGQRPVQMLMKLVPALIGFPRHLSQHVGGFVISEQPLHHLVPVENAAMADRTIIQWDKDDLETLGLLKVDCLALGMLSAIRRALGMVSALRGKPFELSDIPAEDSQTYDMLCRGESTGVFQVESRAQMTMLPRLKPRNFYDLVIETAIIRPGPIQGGMVHPYLRRRQGKESVSYPSPELERVLSRTMGVPLFQEQVMQIAVVAAGFSPGESDQVRRSMAAWQRKGGLEHFRDKLLTGMTARGYSDAFAEQIYKQILGFGSYGFPESHAASFALLIYASAWLKCHEPATFCAALLNAQPMGFYAPAQLVADARRAGVEVLPVDVNRSDWDCTLESRNALRLGMRMIRGMPEVEAASVVSGRRQGAYAKVDELWKRTELTRRGLDALAHAGALAGIAGDRRQARWRTMAADRIVDLLLDAPPGEDSAQLRAPSEVDDLIADYQAVGLTLGRHPLALLRDRLAAAQVSRAADLVQMRSGSAVRVAGLVTHRQRPETASGVMFASLEDETGITNLIIWPSIQEEQRQQILGAQLMVVQGELQNEEGVIHVIAQRVHDRTHWMGQLAMASRDFH
jgi:error-prone DNA polymerase